jgi:hypothetical protein
VYGASSRGAFKILGLHDGDTSPQYLAIYGANAGTAGNTISWNTVGFAQDEDGKVGIGTVSPSSFYESHLVVGDGAGDEAITIYSGSSNTGYLLFGDATSGNARFAGQVRYNHGQNRLSFATNESSSSKFSISSSGDLEMGSSFTTVITSARNIENIGTINTSGNITATGSGDKIISAISSDDDGTLFLSGAGSGKDTHIVFGNDRDLFISKSSSTTATSEGTPVLTLGSNNNATFAGTISSGAITSTGALSVNSGTTDTAAVFTSSDTAVAVNFVASDNSMQIATSGTDGIIKNNGGGSFRLFNNGSERARIDSSGRVGIGTDSPAQQLQVNGNIQVGVGNSKEALIQGTNSGRVASNPAYSFSGDVDTGMFNPQTDNTIAFSTGGTERLRIDSSGNTIFKPSGSETGRFSTSGLSVVGNTAISGNFNTSLGGYQVGGTTVITSARALTNIGTISSGDITASSTSGATLTLEDSGSHNFKIVCENGSNFLNIKEGGNTSILTVDGSNQRVGIGTTSPASKLHLQDGDFRITGVFPRIYLQDSNNNPDYSIFNGNGILRIYDDTNAADRLAISTAGSVGIGTTDPTSHINTSQIYIPIDSSGRFLTLNGGANGSFINLQSSTTTNGDQVGGLFFTRTSAQADAHKQIAAIDAIQDGSSATISGGKLRFWSKTNNSAATTPRMQITPSGNIEIGAVSVFDQSRNLFNIGTISSTDFTTNGAAVVVQNKNLTVVGQPINISAPNSAEMKFLQTTSSTTASKGSIQWFDSNSNSCGTINLKADGAEDNSGVMEFYVTAQTDELGDDPFGINKMMTITENGVTVHGSLSKSSGSFRIDHPLKPDTHDLVHSFVESPQADNLYRGVIDLHNGRATIDLDEWFGMTPGTFLALNRDIQAFVNNADTWDNVRAKVMGSQLVIECQNPESSATVSWLVIGERQDKEIHESSLTDDHGKVIVEPLKNNI